MSAPDATLSQDNPAHGGCSGVTCSPSLLRTGEDGRTYLKFRPQGYADPIELPVITRGSRDEAKAWTWNGSLEKPTLRPSVKTWHADGTISHIWLNDGMCEYLGDSTDGLAGLSVPLFLLENIPVHPPKVGCDDSSDHDSHDEITYNETI